MKKINEETQELDTFLRTSALLVPTDLVQGTLDRFGQTEPVVTNVFKFFFDVFFQTLCWY